MPPLNSVMLDFAALQHPARTGARSAPYENQVLGIFLLRIARVNPSLSDLRAIFKVLVFLLCDPMCNFAVNLYRRVRTNYFRRRIRRRLLAVFLDDSSSEPGNWILIAKISPE